jgi:hypothetical protein
MLQDIAVVLRERCSAFCMRYIQGLERPSRRMLARLRKLGVRVTHGRVGVGNPWHVDGLAYIDLEVPDGIRVRFEDGAPSYLGTLIGVSKK